MPWHVTHQKWGPHHPFLDPSIPKLYNLTRVRQARSGLVVPPNIWAVAAELDGQDVPIPLVRDGLGIDYPFAYPCMVRSGSPLEDTSTTSNAGQFLSLVVECSEDFSAALAEVVNALPRDLEGRVLGVVFIQPLIDSEVAGVTFFDGFYFEEATAEGGNQALTSGRERGNVVRGHIQRGDSRSEWLEKIYDIFGHAIDIEWAVPRTGVSAGQTDSLRVTAGTRVILQVRPALFPIRRNETLSLANHKEILGDPPSPWMVGLLAEVGRPVMGFFAGIDPVVATWNEPYAIELAGRAWLNFSVFFRLMDRWGLPRAMVTEGVGGHSTGAADDARLIPRRFFRSIPRLIRLQWASAGQILGIRRRLRELDTLLDQADGLAGIWSANVEALARSIQTMFALGGMILGMTRVRRFLGIRSGGRVITREMMDQYAAIAADPDPPSRLARLDIWLGRFGHRGPFESDPSQPRFAELRESLRADLARQIAANSIRPPVTPPSWLRSTLARPFFLIDERRELFRNELMRLWQRIRGKILTEAAAAVRAGWIDVPEDIFLLRGEDLAAPPETWRDRIAAARERIQKARALDLPGTASRDELTAIAAREGQSGPDPLLASKSRFLGIGLGRQIVTGTAVRAAMLSELLKRADLPPSPILVVDTLEPSWAIAFHRFAAIVVEMGGELSHASILIREAGLSAVINAPGAFRSIPDGALIQVKPITGEVLLLDLDVLANFGQAVSGQV